MSTWLIEPRDPLIARDGRPASTAQLTTLRFPFPSTLAGAARTRMAADGGSFTLRRTEELQELTAIPVHGPLLAELSGDAGAVASWYAPAPRDVLLATGTAGRLAITRLAPRPLAPGQAMDSLGGGGLLPVFPASGPKPAKPPHGLPAFWRWDVFERWLGKPPGLEEELSREALGIGHLPIERRVHLALQPGERVGIDGALFQTAGLRFLQGGDRRLAPRRFALSLRSGEGTVAGRALRLHEQLAPLGGDRRLAHWYPSPGWPGLPPAVRERIVAGRHARLILLTPACFETGALPGWSGRQWPLGGAVRAIVRAASVPRPEVVSGWDLAFDNGAGKPRGRPKPTRRLAPAGSVYFVELEGGAREDLERWCDSAWLAPLSDAEQDRRDGFGLAALGIWRKEDP